MKENSKTLKKFYWGLIIVLAAVAVTLGVWKLRYLMNFDPSRIEMPSSASKSRSVYLMYKVSTEQAGKTYYVKFEDVVCDAAADPRDGSKHYFRLNVALETDDKKKAAAIENGGAFVVETLRGLMAPIRAGEGPGGKIGEYVKENLKREVNRAFGKNYVSAVYFESYLSQ